MAEERVKEVLQRQINYLTDLISHAHGAKQTKAAETKFIRGSQPYSSGTHCTTMHQSYQTGSSTTSLYCSLPQHQHRTLNFVSKPNLPASSVQQAVIQSRRPDNKITTLQLDNHIKKLETCAQELKLIKSKASALKTAMTSKPDSEGSSSNKTRARVEHQASKKTTACIKQSLSTSNADSNSVHHLSVSTQPISASSSICSLDTTAHLARSSSVAIHAKHRGHLPAEKSHPSHPSGKHPDSVTISSTRSFSSLKDQLALRSAAVTFELGSLKSHLAQLKAEKSNKSKSKTIASINIGNDLPGVTFRGNFQEGSKPKKEELNCTERNSKDGSERGDLGTAKANTAGSEDHQVSRKQIKISAGNLASSADIQLHSSNKSAVVTQCDMKLKDIQNTSFHAQTPQVAKQSTCSGLASTTLEPVTLQTGLASVTTKLDMSHHSNTASKRAPNKVADLKRELEATQEKLVGMRKKIGVMLKESPKKNCHLQDSASTASQHQETDPTVVAESSPRPLCRDGHPAAAAIPVSKTRPFPNRKSLRWSPQKSSLQSSSKESPVVRSSSDTRLPQRASGTDQQETPTSRFSFTHVGVGYLKGKRSPFSLVRMQTAFTLNSSAKTPSSKSISKSPSFQGRHDTRGLKPFVCRYKLQRHCSTSLKGNTSVRSVPGKFISRYKLLKTTSCSYVNPVQCSAPQTASQRAAKVIKSKYKMRKVFVSPTANSPITVSRQCLTNSHLVGRNLRKCGQTSTWTNTPAKHISSRFSPQSLPSTFHRTAARKYGFSSRQRMVRNRSAYLSGRSWSRQQVQSGTAPAPWWMLQYSRKTYLLQQAWRRRMKAISVWHRQQKLNALAVGHLGTQWHHRVHRAKKQQLHKKLLLKRLQWMQKYNMARRRLGQGKSSPAKGRAYKQASHLVMINGILYQSSSRHLTKAATATSASTSTTSNISARTNAPSRAVPAASQSKLSNAVVVRSMKQHKMQTVTVRGVSFKMDSRGTRLQRVHSHSQQDKSPAVSRVDVGGTTYVQTGDGVLEKISDSQTRTVVNRVKQRSIARVAAKFRKNNTEKRKVKACLFYSRFGKCSRGSDCPYLHDPDKIAVCTRFLRGTCKAEKCLFSHKVSKEKMPVCAFFLRGVCTREQCPYLHVKVTHGADICKDFVNGFCSLADKCQKLHTLTCPHFARTGMCPDGKKCHLMHRRYVRHARRCTTSGVAQQNSPSGSGIKRKASTTGAQSAVQQEFQQMREHNALPQKCVKPNQDTDPNSPPSKSNTPAQEVAQAYTASVLTVDAAPVPQSDYHSEEMSDCSVKGNDERERSESKPAKLPAFISLADYTVEDSPVVKLSDSRRQKISNRMKVASLQIKPRI